MTKAQKAERAEAIEQLRGWIKPGDTVYTVLDSVSRSGMSRVIRVVFPYTARTYPNFNPETGKCEVECECTFGRGDHGTFLQHHDPAVRVAFNHPNWAVGKALGLKHGLVIGGCGMDMGFHLVYELSHVLYGSGYPCLGKGADGRGRCPSNYHSNHRDRIRCDGLEATETTERRHCYKPDRWGRWEVPADWPTGPDREYPSEDGPVTIPGPLLACLAGSGEPCPNNCSPLDASDPESSRVYFTGDEPDGAGTECLTCERGRKPYEVCPTCGGAGDLANPEGPERWDLVHTDGYALRHRWL